MTTWYIWGGWVFCVRLSSTTEPPSSRAGLVTGGAALGEGGFVAMNFILATRAYRCRKRNLMFIRFFSRLT
ncbi:hypothetical protein LJR118_002535 [Acidovorax sp. LjRoot118]|uniref:hypothetical protein n=1 Tax=Acidovorax sp. LjRoot118 TaxID=3342256 RepID=UPI003ED0B2B0